VTIAASVQADQVVVEASGQMTINSGQTWTLANGAGTDLSISGTVLNQGTFSRSASATWVVNSGGTFIHNATSAIVDPLDGVTLDAQSNFIYRGSSTLNARVSISNRTYGNLSFESASGTWTPTLSGGNSLTLNGDFTLGSNVVFNADTSHFTGAINVKGNWTNSGTFNADSGTGTVTFNGSSAQTIGGTVTSQTFNNLTLSNISGGVSVGGSTTTLTLNGAFTITTGSFTAPANLNVAGNWTNNGTFTANSGKVTFNGSGASTFSGSSTTTFYDLEISSNTTLDVSTNTLFNATNSVRNYGKLKQTQTISTANVAFLNISSGKYYGVEIDPEGSTSMGSTTVTIYGEQNCPTPPSLGVTAVKRCFDISPTTSTASTVKFWYDATNEINGNTQGSEKAYSQQSGLWYTENGDYTRSASSFNLVQVTGVSSFSRFALTSNTPSSPNLITLAAFTAAPSVRGVLLAWDTASELDTAGFNLWRGDAAAGPYAKVNAALIPAVGGPTWGASYSFTDATVADGATYYYKLEEVDVYGLSAFHGPTAVTVGMTQSWRYLPLVGR
jgi:hypothetical protein